MYTKEDIESGIIKMILDADKIKKFSNKLMIYPPKKIGLKFVKLNISDWSLVDKKVLDAIDFKLKQTMN